MSVRSWLERAAGALVAQHRRQPLVAGAALFLAGVAVGYRLGAWPAALGGVLVCGCALPWLAGAAWRYGAAAVLVLLTGWLRAAWDRAGRQEEADRLRGLKPRQTFVCRVGPEVVARPLRGESAKFIFRAERLRLEQEALAIRHLPAEVTWFGSLRAAGAGAPQPGQVWRFDGRANVRRGRDGLWAMAVNTGEDRSERLALADAASWPARVERARRAAAGRVALGIEDWADIAALNQAMLLGSRHEMSPAMRRVFADSGTIHVFAISGLHIVLVASILSLAVSALGVPRPYWVIAIAPLLVFYTVTTGARPSAIRACLMAVLYFAAPLAGRKPSGVAALAGTALIVHGFQPWLIYDAGCVLSFAVMGGLVMFCRPFCELGQRLCRVGHLEAQVRLLDAGGEKARGSRIRWLKAAVKLVSDSFSVSLAAWLASVPLTACYFGRFTPGGLFANLVVAPCSFFIVVAGCLGMAASCVSGLAASCFNHAAGFFTLVMVKTAAATARCPGGNFRIGRWEPWMVVAWFVGLALLACWLRLRRKADGLAWLEQEPGGH